LTVDGSEEESVKWAVGWPGGTWRVAGRREGLGSEAQSIPLREAEFEMVSLRFESPTTPHVGFNFTICPVTSRPARINPAWIEPCK